MLLTVVVPAYNVGPFISRTLDSLTRQVVPVHQIVLVDDGSTDETPAVLRRYSEVPGSRLQVIVQSNQGVSTARNVGLAASTGDYVLFLDGDDIIHPTLTVELQHAISNQTPPDVIAWKFDTVDEEGKSVPFLVHANQSGSIPALSNGPQTLARILKSKRQWIWTGNAAYSRDFLTENGLQYTVGCKAGEDLEFSWKVLSLAETVLWVDKSLSSYFIARPGSTTNSPSANRVDDVAALVRTTDVMSQAGNAAVGELAGIVRDKAIQRYFLHLGILRRAHVPPRRGLQAIERRHPGLTMRVRSMLAQSMWEQRRFTPGRALPLLSPEAFMRVSAIRETWSDRGGSRFAAMRGGVELRESA